MHSRKQTLNLVFVAEWSCSKDVSTSRKSGFNIFNPAACVNGAHHLNSASAPLFVESISSLFPECLEDTSGILLAIAIQDTSQCPSRAVCGFVRCALRVMLPFHVCRWLACIFPSSVSMTGAVFKPCSFSYSCVRTSEVLTYRYSTPSCPSYLCGIRIKPICVCCVCLSQPAASSQQFLPFWFPFFIFCEYTINRKKENRRGSDRPRLYPITVACPKCRLESED